MGLVLRSDGRTCLFFFLVGGRVANGWQDSLRQQRGPQCTDEGGFMIDMNVYAVPASVSKRYSA
jgi:hypothetical protein